MLRCGVRRGLRLSSRPAEWVKGKEDEDEIGLSTVGIRDPTSPIAKIETSDELNEVIVHLWRVPRRAAIKSVTARNTPCLAGKTRRDAC